MLLRRLLPLFLIGFLIIGSSGGVLAARGGPDNPAAPADLAGTGFTYQGELANAGNLVNGTCDFQFALWDSLSTGSQVGATETQLAVSVVNGRFTVVLNSGGLFGPRAFDGSARWLEISVRCPAGVSGYATLHPRQPLTPAPYALALPGLRTEQNATSPNVIGGYISNTVTAGKVAATIGGGGSPGSPNTVTNHYGTVSGGHGNTASGGSASVVGGENNTASGSHASVVGGYGNKASGDDAIVVGGNRNSASGAGAFVGGGGWDGSILSGNIVTGVAGTIGGGLGNQVTGAALYGTVSGGITNTASDVNAVVAGGKQNTASGAGAVVGGGFSNSDNGINAVVAGGQQNTADGNYSTVPGGIYNQAMGTASFAAGNNALAQNDGAFVWGDNTGAVLASTADNQFLVRASGGITLYTNTGLTSGAALYPGSSSWNIVSDRNAKANFAGVDGLQVLNALAGIPIQTWNYKTQDAAIRHIGPMAQDFHTAFGVGENDTTISTVDAQGVALAAIQGLYTLVQQKDAKIAAQQAEITMLQSGQAKTDARLAALETQAAQAGQPAPAPSQLPLALPWLLLGGLILLNVGGLAGYVLARRLRTRP